MQIPEGDVAGFNQVESGFAPCESGFVPEAGGGQRDGLIRRTLQLVDGEASFVLASGEENGCAGFGEVESLLKLPTIGNPDGRDLRLSPSVDLVVVGHGDVGAFERPHCELRRPTFAGRGAIKLVVRDKDLALTSDGGHSAPGEGIAHEIGRSSFENHHERRHAAFALNAIFDHPHRPPGLDADAYQFQR